jgi:hypothetical protein
VKDWSSLVARKNVAGEIFGVASQSGLTAAASVVRVQVFSAHEKRSVARPGLYDAVFPPKKVFRWKQANASSAGRTWKLA